MGIIIQCIISVLIFIVGVILLPFLKKKVQDVRIVNYALSGAALFFYILLIISDGVYHHWDAETIADVNPLSKLSPFVFATAFFINFTPNAVKRYYFTIISTLIIPMAYVGMFAALTDGLMNDMNYFVIWMYFDSFSHIAIALLGIWLVITGQTSLERKTLLQCLGILYSFLLILIVVNLIFKTNFFGFSVYGGHHIYAVVIDPWILSFVTYFAGLTAFVVGDWFLCKAIASRSEPTADPPEKQQPLT